MKLANCIFIVFGTYAKDDLSNIKSIDTFVIPNIGETIVIDGKRRKVVDKVIDYSQVEGYDSNSKGRGGEYIYICTIPL